VQPVGRVESVGAEVAVEAHGLAFRDKVGLVVLAGGLASAGA
jgi:hypothetical protein